ncbi:MAG: organomercurial lyase [Acidimicrobiia bacterium]
MDEPDRLLRNATYQLFVDLGRAPTPAQVATAIGLPKQTVEQGWHRLHEAHALVLSKGGELLMANPFAALPTPHRVEATGSHWYANCAWDAFGICAALGTDGRVTTTCPDCGEELVVVVQGQRPLDDSTYFHCLVPARAWWDDIAFT